MPIKFFRAMDEEVARESGEFRKSTTGTKTNLVLGKIVNKIMVIWYLTHNYKDSDISTS